MGFAGRHNVIVRFGLSQHVILMAATKVGGILRRSLIETCFFSSSRQILCGPPIWPASAGSLDLLHLSQIRAAADQGRRAADRPARADQRMVRDRKNRRDQALSASRSCPATSMGKTTISTLPRGLPALIRKFHAAESAGKAEVIVWGTGTLQREFLYVDVLADSVVFLMDRNDGDEPTNCGAGPDVTIRQLADVIGRVVGFERSLVFDPSKPDGTRASSWIQAASRRSAGGLRQVSKRVLPRSIDGLFVPE